MNIVPIFQKEAFAFVVKHHNHHEEPVGSIFQTAIHDGNEIVGVAIVGRPSGPKLDDGFTVEVTRLCVLRDRKIPNGCSMLYGVCTRISKDLGYKKIVTFTLMSEPGTSLKASGWILEAENVGGSGKWNKSVERQNKKPDIDLFGEVIKKYPDEKKKRWIKILNP